MSSTSRPAIPVITPGGSQAAGAVRGVPYVAVVNLDRALIHFPFRTWHPNDFRHGGCCFGAPRRSKKGLRLHAGVDLLAPFGTPLLALADGFVRQAPYDFYEGTNALELVFPGIGVARYGEITKRQDPVLRAGQSVEGGQLVAHVGRLNSGSSMLHFELYQSRDPHKDVADFDSEPLTQKTLNAYGRHPNLVNPTNFMWELHDRTSAGQ